MSQSPLAVDRNTHLLPNTQKAGTTPLQTILVVDDNPANLQLLAEMLKEHGYRVRPVPSGKLAIRAIQYSSMPGENVLDLFGGSGSTLIACEKTFRHCRMMELDPAYVDVIVKRWEQFTGNKAMLELISEAF